MPETKAPTPEYLFPFHRLRDCLSSMIDAGNELDLQERTAQA